MKLGHALAFTLAFALCGYVGSVKAEETVKVEEKSDNGKNEFKMKVSRHDDGHYYGNYNNRDYEIRGDNVTFKSEGEYYVRGDLDNRGYISYHSSRPVVVEERERVIEKRDPLVKVGPLEIK
jgi:hypothetical protein